MNEEYQQENLPYKLKLLGMTLSTTEITHPKTHIKIFLKTSLNLTIYTILAETALLVYLLSHENSILRFFSYIFILPSIVLNIIFLVYLPFKMKDSALMYKARKVANSIYFSQGVVCSLGFCFIALNNSGKTIQEFEKYLISGATGASIIPFFFNFLNMKDLYRACRIGFDMRSSTNKHSLQAKF